MKYFVINVLILTVLLSSCTKDHFSTYQNPIDSNDVVISILPCSLTVVDYQKHDTFPDIDLYNGCFEVFYEWQEDFTFESVLCSPNNNDEIVFLKKKVNGGWHESELYHFNLCSGEGNCIAVGGRLMDWNIDDWLLLIQPDQNIYKIKTDGTGLQQLTFDGDYNNQPRWNPDGARFVYTKVSNGKGYFIIADENGVALDTLENVNNNSLPLIHQWPIKNKILITSDVNGKFQIAFFDIDKKNHEMVANWLPHTPVVEQARLNSSTNELFWNFHYGKIYYSKEGTLESDSIISYKNNKWIPDFDLSYDNKKIFFVRHDFEEIVWCRQKAWSKLFVCDIDGSNIMRLDLP